MVHYLLHKHSRLVAGGKMARQIRCTLEELSNYILISHRQLDIATDLTIKQEHFLPSKDRTCFLAR